MEGNKANSGLPPGFNPTQQQRLWRPWNKNEQETNQRTTYPLHEGLNAQHKMQQVIHPVKLFWPKTRCFDYLYRDAEKLLRNYPVQATICPYEDSSSEEEEEEEEDEAEKKQN